MSKILIVSYYFPPFNGPGAQHPSWFHRYLGEQGFDTTAITSAVYYNPGAVPVALPEKIQNVLHLPESGWARSLCPRLYKAEMQVQVRMGYWEPGFVWGKMFAIPAAKRLLERDQFDAIISVSPTVTSHWIALQLKRRFPKLKWIADFQDPFLGNPFHKKPSPKAQQFERDVFAEADVLSANTDTVLEMWSNRYPEYAQKMMVTWGGYDPSETVEAGPLSSETPVLSHVGALYGARVPTALLASVDRLATKGLLKPRDLELEFVGDLDFGPVAELAQRLKQGGWLKLQPTYVPRAEALQIAGRAHYSLLLDVTLGNNILQVPAKLFDQVRIGRPILAFTPEGSPAGRILEGSGTPHFRLKPDAAPELVDRAVLGLLKTSPEPQAAKPWFEQNFDARYLAAGLGARIATKQSP